MATPTSSIRSRAAAVTLATVLSACGACDDTTLGSGSSSLAVDRTRIDLGRVYVGASATATFELSAPGDLAVSYETALDGDPFGYQVGPANGRLGPNTGVEMLVVFRPGRAGPAQARAVVTSNATKNATVAVDLFAVGIDPPDCEDGNGCTDDRFDLDLERCVHTANRAPCDDFNACTSGDTCVEGTCLGESFSCDDDDVCTDDLCDGRQGCVHLPSMACGDDNPCTADLCDAVRGCTNVAVDDGTPCDDLEQCTIGDICLGARCIGVNIPDGTACEDGNPCSKLDQCTEGVCRDPTYQEPGIGELKFATDVGALADGASTNPIVDRDSTVFVGLEDGVTAVDHCGDVLWTNRAIGRPRFGAAVSLPGILTVPVGSKIVDLDTRAGDVIRELDLAPLFPAVSTASTATVSVRIVDLALRASGAIVASVVRETRPVTEAADAGVVREGLIAEIDRFHTAASRFLELGDAHASRLAVDGDEAIVAIVRRGAPDKGAADEHLVRLGLAGLPETTWSLSPIEARHTELAFGPSGDALWSAGLVSVSKTGELRPLFEAGPTIARARHGSPVTSGTRLVLVSDAAGPLAELRLALEDVRPSELVVLEDADGSIVWTAPLDAGAPGMSPAIDAAGNVYVAAGDGVLHAFQATGTPLFEVPLPITSDGIEDVALTVTPEGVVVAIARGRVFGVKSFAPISGSSWPRHRRDNLSTGHR
ncbi:PQQ-binding-like beta-propeller repeat protein [Myxococcota bacterium]|nr:PQQ-binding-like beta-propeller repeat protein [Myxococcota bacterium]